MLENCSSLKLLNVSNFNTQNVINMVGMFENCSSLKSLNINFEIKYNTKVDYMFSKISNELKAEIKRQNNRIEDIAFM